jgi:hypothetical protein
MEMNRKKKRITLTKLEYQAPHHEFLSPKIIASFNTARNKKYTTGTTHHLIYWWDQFPSKKERKIIQNFTDEYGYKFEWNSDEIRKVLEIATDSRLKNILTRALLESA